MNIPDPSFRFSPGRGPAVASTAMVSSSQPAATLAGLDVLRRGGNAADAALAAAACLCVSEPMSNGIGGDGFALVWDGGTVHGLDAGGAAPLSLDESADVEAEGPSSVVVPALIAGWVELNRRFGRLGFDECLAPAIDLAERGVAAGYHCSYSWAHAANAPTGFGAPPAVAKVFVIPDLAGTLREVAEEGPDIFYKGAIAEAIVDASWLAMEDLAAVRPQWVSPLSVRYRGVDVFEMPPPTQGVAALEGLALLERLGEATPVNLVTAVALSLEDALREVRDGAGVDHLLDERRLDRRALEKPNFPLDLPGGTVYLCALDGDGMAVSLIQSLYGHFGSGVLVPGTGVVLNNRAACFRVVGHLQSGRRPYHTTIPGMLVRDGTLVGPFGVMGGFLQAQAHVQLVSAVVDRGLDPQAALDEPRFRIDRDAVCLEEGLWGQGAAYAPAGARAVLDPERLRFGGGQMIQVSDGRIFGGSDARKDGFAAGY
jgi:gamma-glutamyltranspeptidase / glutathione hydrolase